ncbi:MAG TPA: PaaI family thioesterase [Calditrichia bacterium]|nr:PaaI family thioesterase [Calditrichota bacterium]HQU74127.1 PaaI family thioesterase [Calditrichia bacterium]HQV31947.1 PaaI family thioesterase [Calditrichia bacterium]
MSHYHKLENLFLSAPCNRNRSYSIEIGKGTARISCDLGEDDFHGGGAVHGSRYFKGMDDAAYFACQSLVRDNFLLTASFTVYLLRPFQGGTIRAQGRVISAGRRQLLAEAEVEDQRGKLLGKGSGLFTRSETPLDTLADYR